MTNEYIIIKSCSDPMMWYSDKIGQEYKLLSRHYAYKGLEFLVRTDDHWNTVNIIKEEDAEVCIK